MVTRVRVLQGHGACIDELEAAVSAEEGGDGVQAICEGREACS